MRTMKKCVQTKCIFNLDLKRGRKAMCGGCLLHLCLVHFNYSLEFADEGDSWAVTAGLSNWRLLASALYGR